MSKPSRPREGRRRRSMIRILPGGEYAYRFERYLKAKLMWHRVYRAVSYVKSALWIAPLLALLAVLALAPVIRVLDVSLGWRVADLGMTGAQALYDTVITLTLSFMVFTFGSLLVAIQVAGGQLTPRIIATTLLRDNVVRFSVGLFVFTLILSVTAQNRLENKVYELVTLLVGVLGLACTGAFLFLIDYAARLLRPVSILARIGDEGRDVIDTVYPSPVGEGPEVQDTVTAALGSPTRIVLHEGNSGIVLALDIETLVLEAQRAGGIIEFIPQVGDFVSHEEPLFALYGEAADISYRKLVAAVALGPERTLEQDPMFGLRILVDIALKALSAAINDPTTAVLALDQIHRFLRRVGRRALRDEGVADELGQVRVFYRTPDWEDFVTVACSEIRACGANSFQVVRRMRAMLQNLCATLPEHRHAPLLAELERLDIAIETRYPIPADLALAREPDSQGLGGSARATAAPARPTAAPVPADASARQSETRRPATPATP